ncbi:unnamed protein product [Arabidopsis halleri]
MGLVGGSFDKSHSEVLLKSSFCFLGLLDPFDFKILCFCS